jgi:protein tyrosine/serine phosphatase
MKTANSLGILCLTFFALTGVALADDGDTRSHHTTAEAPTASVAASNSAKMTWPESSTPSHRVVAKGLPNFGSLNDVIWRSGQPTREGYQYLATRGLKTVVNLREEFPQDKDLIPEGVQYIHIPISDEHAPTDEQAKEILKIASDPANWPLLLHCQGGEGRAGTMTAVIRCSLDKWDHNKIMREVNNFRNIRLGFIKIPMAMPQQRFIRHWEETNGAAPPQ